MEYGNEILPVEQLPCFTDNLVVENNKADKIYNIVIKAKVNELKSKNISETVIGKYFNKNCHVKTDESQLVHMKLD